MTATITSTALQSVYSHNGQTSFSFDQTGISAGNVSVNSINGGQLAGMRNRIINGKMDISQRGTSFAAVAATQYSLDRWNYGISGSTAAVTISQQADAPANNEFQNSLRVTVTTADASIAAGDVVYLHQHIEGYNVRDLIGRAFTVSFWVKSSKTGVHCVALRNSGNDRSFVAEYTINAANAWEYKTLTVSAGLITAGAWNWTNGTGLQVGFTLAAGSTFQTTAGSWQAGNLLDTANQVNCLDTVGNVFAVTGVQLEAGAVATPFEHRVFGAELALCQRYYQKKQHVVNTASVNSVVSLIQEMRAAPTVGAVTFDTGTGATFTPLASANIIYQTANHNIGPATATIPLSAEL